MFSYAFLFSILPVCLVLVASFFALNRAVRTRAREGIKKSLHQTEKILNTTIIHYNTEYRQLLAHFGDDARWQTWINLFQESPSTLQDRTRLHEIIGTELIELAKGLDYDLLMITDLRGDPIAGCVMKAGRMVHLDSLPPASSEQNPECLTCHLVDAFSLHFQVEGNLY